jgi:hypothetical protein
MPVSANLTGTSGAELRYLAAKFRKAAARDLTRVLKRAQRNAVKPLQREIKEEALATLPKRGGYNALMSRAVKVSVTGGTPGKKLIVRIYARGRTEERDVAKVNAGILRHPFYGKRSRWYTTTVPRGFVDRPIDNVPELLEHLASDEIKVLLEEIARR